MKQGLSATAGTLALIVALAWALSPQAQAQNASDQAAGAADQPTAQNGAAGAQTLQEVVVTAERRAVDIQQTPIAVTALQGDQLQSLHLSTMADVQTMVPGFQDSDQGGYFSQNNIRGLGTTALSPLTQNGVTLLRDGMFIDNDVGQDEPLYDQADVEVLEGPQGTFVGVSAIAGAIEINSVNPSFNGFNGYVQAGFGNYTDLQYQGAVNLPVNDTFALRLAFYSEQAHSFSNDIGDTLSGYYYTSYSATAPQTDGPPKLLNQGSVGYSSLIDPGSTDTHSYRLKALWKPTDNFQALAEIEYGTTDTGGVPYEPNPITYQNLFAYPGGCSTVAGTTFTGNQLVCPGAGLTEHSTYYYPGEQPFVLDYYGTAQQYEDVVYHYSTELRYTLPDGIVLRSLSAFLHINNLEQYNNSYGPQDAGWTYHPNGPNEGFPSEELDLISPTTGKVNWVAGAFWYYKSATVPFQIQSVGSPYQPGTLPTSETYTVSGSNNRIAAVFGQLNWQFTNTLQLQVGARENWDNNFASNPFTVAPNAGTLLSEPNGTGTYSVLYTAAACGTITPPCYKVIAPSTATGRYQDSVPTGKADLNWTPLPGQNFYLFYARGYSAGGVNAGSIDHPLFQPETVNDWEVGWKGRVLDGHMLTQIGVYHEIVQNFQYPLEDTEALNDTSVGSYIANLAPSSIDGVTASEQSRFGGLGVDLAFDYNHTSLGNVRTVNNAAFPAGFGSPLASPQCLSGHTYTAPQECFDYTPYLTNLSGEPNGFAPEFQGNLTVDYLLHVGVGTLDPRVTYSYTAKQYASIFDSSYSEMGARNLWGATLDWVVGKWDTQLWSKNLNNETYFMSIYGSDVVYGPPRQFGIQENYRF